MEVNNTGKLPALAPFSGPDTNPVGLPKKFIQYALLRLPGLWSATRPRRYWISLNASIDLLILPAAINLFPYRTRKRYINFSNTALLRGIYTTSTWYFVWLLST